MQDPLPKETGATYLNEIKIPEYDKCWVLELTEGFVIVPLRGKVPNWFRRKMHWLVLGFKWKNQCSK
jgi:hypothetical protein